MAGDKQQGETKAVSYSLERRGPSQTRRPRVVWTDFRGTHAHVLTGRAVVGSSPSADIVVTEPTVSRIHAELEPKADGVWIRDLGSKNGTLVSMILVTGARIPLGGRVRVGATELSIESSDETVTKELWPSNKFNRLVGRSELMRELFAYLAKVAASDASVLIRGETGTGKEAVAQSIHDASPRRTQPFVVVDCSAIPETLIESELFGSTKGAFTGATARVGALEAAHGGTVFFDEIGELPLSMQPKLLRILEAREIRRLGETVRRPIDVRFVFASHRDLREMVNVGAFREDLYFRIAVLPVVVPPLRDRLDDLPELVAHFLPPQAPGPSPELLSELANHKWLGNVRELRNFVDRSRAVGTEQALRMTATADRREGMASVPDLREAGLRDTGAHAVALPHAVAHAASSAVREPEIPDETERTSRALGDTPPIPTEQPYSQFREQWIEHGERLYVSKLLERNDRQVAKAAVEADLDRRYLYRLIRKHDL